MTIAPPFHYCVHGLHVEAGFDLPELQRLETPDDPRILDPRPARILSASLPRTIQHHAVSKDGYLIGDGQVFMALVNGIRCLVANGQTVTIDVDDPALEPAARLFALSAGLGTLLHQRGFIPLHCAAIETPAGCVAFIGNAGDGKSTLAASLSSAGFKLFTDDRLTLHKTANAAYVAAPSLPVLHLFEDGSQLAGLDGSGLAVSSYRFGKHVHIVPGRYAQYPRAMAGLYFTDWLDEPDSDPRIVPMGAIDAMMRLRRDVSLAHLVELLGQEKAFLSWAAALCGSVPAFSLLRPKNAKLHQHCMDLIVRDVQDKFWP